MVLQQLHKSPQLSPSMSRPAPSKLATIQALGDSLGVLGVFAEEFFDRTTRRFVATAREFVEDIRMLNTVRDDEAVPTIAHWFDCVFEDYRRAVEVDTLVGASSRTTIHAKFNIQEPRFMSFKMSASLPFARLPSAHINPNAVTPLRGALTLIWTSCQFAYFRKMCSRPSQIRGQSRYASGISAIGVDHPRTRTNALITTAFTFLYGSIPQVQRNHIDQYFGGVKKRDQRLINP